MLTASLKKSFQKGFTAPGNLLLPFSSELSYDEFPQPVGVEVAWAQVRHVLADAFAVEREAINAQKNAAARARCAGKYPLKERSRSRKKR